MTSYRHLDINDLGYTCTGDDVIFAGHVTSSKVTNNLLAITLERKEIQCRGWSHCVSLVKTLQMLCILTYLMGHRVTLT